MRQNPQQIVNLVKFAKEILDGKLHFLRSESIILGCQRNLFPSKISIILITYFLYYGDIKY